MNQKQFDPPPGLDHRFLVTWSFMSGVLQYQDLVVAGSLSTRLLALRSFRTRIIDSLLVMDVFWCFFHIQSQVPGADLGSKPCSWFPALSPCSWYQLLLSWSAWNWGQRRKKVFFLTQEETWQTQTQRWAWIRLGLWRKENCGEGGDGRGEETIQDERCQSCVRGSSHRGIFQTDQRSKPIELSAFIVQGILWVGAVLLQTLWGGTHFEKTTNHPDPVCKYNS